MGKYDFIKIKKKLSKYLDEARFEHTMGVMYTCAALAMVYDYDLEDAQAAGLLHDSAKCIPNKKKLKLCSQHDIPVSDFEKDHPFLLHAKLGALPSNVSRSGVQAANPRSVVSRISRRRHTLSCSSPSSRAVGRRWAVAVQPAASSSDNRSSLIGRRVMLPNRGYRAFRRGRRWPAAPRAEPFRASGTGCRGRASRP